MIAGVGTLLVRRLRGSGGGEVSEAIWFRGGRLELVPSLLRGVLSIVTVAMGASLGREGAPQLAGAAFASELCERTRAITPAQRRLLVAAGAGAGMAAVYNVPLGGALFALEVLLGSLALPLVLPALLTSLIATAVGWLVIPTHATYAVAGARASPRRQIVWAALIGPLAGLVAVAWVRLVIVANRAPPVARGSRACSPRSWSSRRSARSRSPTRSCSATARSSPRPSSSAASRSACSPCSSCSSRSSRPPAWAAARRAACSRRRSRSACCSARCSATPGRELWPGSPIASYALIGGGAVLAAAMQGPLCATVLMLELTHSNGALTVPLLLAVGRGDGRSRGCCGSRRSTPRGSPIRDRSQVLSPEPLPGQAALLGVGLIRSLGGRARGVRAPRPAPAGGP